MSNLALVAALLFQAVPSAKGIIPLDDLQIEEGEQPVFPKAFRGYWAPSLKACADDTAIDGMRIARNRTYGYESDSSLLIITPVNHHDTPSREDALTVTALVAERGESEVGIGKVRISRVGSKLYMSRADTVSEAEHFTNDFANVRCPE